MGVKPILLILLACGLVFSLAGCALTAPNLPWQPAPTLPSATPPEATPRPTIPQATAILIPTAKVEQPTVVLPTPQAWYTYTTQSGDYLANLATRFGVGADEIRPPAPLPTEGLIKPGQILLIPRRLGETSPSTAILPDCEVVYSSTALDLDLKTYIKNANGRLNTYSEYLANSTHTGAEVLLMVAQDYSINPRLLLALLEYQSHWVFGQPGNIPQEEYPLGYNDINFRGLYKQLTWAARQLSLGYYGWREGSLTSVTFPNHTGLRISPEVNAGTVAVQYFFARFFNQREWSGVLYAEGGFPGLYEKMYGTPWIRAQSIDPFFPPNLVQPVLELPFYYERIWSFTGGPHPAWSVDSPRAALDFAPGSMESGCIPSQEWVLSAAPGLVIRSDVGVVVVDLDGDGIEQTGWALIYLHIASEGRVVAGTRLNVNTPIGRPSCEGGIATGTHFHIVRKYNGEWILADGPLPFVLGGWRAHAGAKDYEGTLTRDGQTIIACTCSSYETKISRPRQTAP